MNPIVDALFASAAVAYVLVAVRFALFLFGQASGGLAQTGSTPGHTESNTLPGQIVPLLALAVFAHSAHIVVGSLILRVCPMGGVAFPLSLASLLASLLYLVFRARYRVDALGAFVAPLSLLGLLLSRFMVLDTSSRIKSAVLPFHILANLLGVALFSLASFAAVLYLVQEKRLKQKKLVGLFQRLPALDVLDRAEHSFLLAGFPLFTFGILSGTVWAASLSFTSADFVRTGFAYLTWLLFAAVLVLRAMLGWRGRRAALGTLIGFGFTLLLLGFYMVRTTLGAS
jgi:ABC-type uncharacterized transport system permease subunit